MNRRDFFRQGARKLTEAALEELEASATARARHWIRPPYALPELDLLLACTRCSECIDACPYGVIFPLPASLGAQVAGTPALDLLNKGCHLCRDWPCVKACEPAALQIPEPPESGPTAAPRMAVVVIDSSTCLPYNGPECGACAGSCPVPGALTWQAGKPAIDQEHCTGCGLCREACILDPKAVIVRAGPERTPAHNPED